MVACLRSLLALSATPLRAGVDDFIHVACGARLQCVASRMVVGEGQHDCRLLYKPKASGQRHARPHTPVSAGREALRDGSPSSKQHTRLSPGPTHRPGAAQRLVGGAAPGHLGLSGGVGKACLQGTDPASTWRTSQPS